MAASVVNRQYDILGVPINGVVRTFSLTYRSNSPILDNLDLDSSSDGASNLKDVIGGTKNLFLLLVF